MNEIWATAIFDAFDIIFFFEQVVMIQRLVVLQLTNDIFLRIILLEKSFSWCAGAAARIVN